MLSCTADGPSRPKDPPPCCWELSTKSLFWGCQHQRGHPPSTLHFLPGESTASDWLMQGCKGQIPVLRESPGEPAGSGAHWWADWGVCCRRIRVWPLPLPGPVSFITLQTWTSETHPSASAVPKSVSESVSWGIWLQGPTRDKCWRLLIWSSPPSPVTSDRV